MSKGGLTDVEFASAKSLLHTLLECEESIDFREPVDYETLGLTDYPNVIKRPMDLGTVQKKLEGGEYADFDEVCVDLALIWENCKTYNEAGSPIVTRAEVLEKVVRRWQTRVQMDSDSVSFEAKVSFAEKVRRADLTVKSEMLNVVESECPDAIKPFSEGKVAIVVDLLTLPLFHKLNAMVQSREEERKMKEMEENFK